jgi:hypothetical protein
MMKHSRFIWGLISLITAISVYTACGSVFDTAETAPTAVLTAETTATPIATAAETTTAKLTTTAPETTTAQLTTTAPETTTAYIRDTSNDIPFSGEINADSLEYAKMLNISSGDGYMAFDDEFIYYTDFEDDAGDNYVYDPDKIYKTPINGGEPIVVFDRTDVLYYQKISNIILANDRIYFRAIETPHDFDGGSDNFFATLYSINTDGGDLRLEVTDDFAQVYITDNKAYYYREYLGSIEPGFTEYDMETDEYRETLDLFGFYSLVTDNIILYTGFVPPVNSFVIEFYNINLFDRNSGEELFRMDGAKYFSPTALYGDYLISPSGEFVNIRTFEFGTFYDNDDNEKIDGMNIYQNKLYFYVLTEKDNLYTSKKLVSYDFTNGEREETELFSSETPKTLSWWENYLYSTPVGLFSYDESGKIYQVNK